MKCNYLTCENKSKYYIYSLNKRIAGYCIGHARITAELIHLEDKHHVLWKKDKIPYETDTQRIKNNKIKAQKLCSNKGGR